MPMSDFFFSFLTVFDSIHAVNQSFRTAINVSEYLHLVHYALNTKQIACVKSL